MTKNILVGYDGSDLSKEALQEAKKLVSLIPELQVYVVSVVTTGGPSTNITIARTLTMELAENMEPEMLEIKRDFGDDGIYIHTKVLADYQQRNPGKLICEFADDIDIDLIIIGSRGMGKMKQFLLGSVSNYVVHHAECKVLIVK